MHGIDPVFMEGALVAHLSSFLCRRGAKFPLTGYRGDLGVILHESCALYARLLPRKCPSRCSKRSRRALAKSSSS